MLDIKRHETKNLNKLVSNTFFSMGSPNAWRISKRDFGFYHLKN